MPKLTPRMIREAVGCHEPVRWALKPNEHVHISHQTGAQLMALPFHTMELTNMFKQPRPAQNMYRQVPVFQASRCQGKGMAQARKPRKAKVEKTGLGMGPGAEDILKEGASEEKVVEGG